MNFEQIGLAFLYNAVRVQIGVTDRTRLRKHMQKKKAHPSGFFLQGISAFDRRAGRNKRAKETALRYPHQYTRVKMHLNL